MLLQMLLLFPDSGIDSAALSHANCFSASFFDSSIVVTGWSSLRGFLIHHPKMMQSIERWCIDIVDAGKRTSRSRTAFEALLLFAI